MKSSEWVFFSALYRDHTSKETNAKHTHTRPDTHLPMSRHPRTKPSMQHMCDTATHTCKHTHCLHPAERRALCQAALAFSNGWREMSSTAALVEVKKQHFHFVFCAFCVTPYADFYIGEGAATLILDVCFLCVCYIFDVPRRIIVEQIVSCKKQKQ